MTTAFRDANDISQAGDYIRLNMASQQFTVIAMNGTNFNGFPATIYPVANLEDAPPNLGPCLLQQACNQGQNCKWMTVSCRVTCLNKLFSGGFVVIGER